MTNAAILKLEIDRRMRLSAFPDESCRYTIGFHAVADLARVFGIPGRDVEIAALRKGVIPERYMRNLRTFSPEDQIRLLKSSVAVVGLGGLGGYVTEILARGGVGRLTLIDGDRFEDSNLNRQMLSAPDLLNAPKAEAAAERVRRINPSVTVTRRDSFLDAENAATLISGAHLAADCLDNIRTRMILESAARSLNIPLISTAIAGNSGHVTTVFPEDAGLERLHGGRNSPREKGAEATLGCPPHTAALMAALESAEIFKVLLKKKNLLRNRLLLADTEDYTFQTLELT